MIFKQLVNCTIKNKSYSSGMHIKFYLSLGKILLRFSIVMYALSYVFFFWVFKLFCFFFVSLLIFILTKKSFNEFFSSLLIGIFFISFFDLQGLINFSFSPIAECVSQLPLLQELNLDIAFIDANKNDISHILSEDELHLLDDYFRLRRDLILNNRSAIVIQFLTTELISKNTFKLFNDLILNRNVYESQMIQPNSSIISSINSINWDDRIAFLPESRDAMEMSLHFNSHFVSQQRSLSSNFDNNESIQTLLHDTESANFWIRDEIFYHFEIIILFCTNTSIYKNY